MNEAVEVTQADRDRAAEFASFAWHLFWPNNYERAMQDAKDIRAGRCDNWHLVQAFARHRIASVAAARPFIMEEAWQPIETAPKDGTVVLFHVPNGRDMRMARADDFWAGAWWLADASHWMPLPPPPMAHTNEVM